MLRCQRYISCAGARDDISPSIRIKKLGTKHGGKVEIREIGAVHALVKGPCERAISRGSFCFLAFRQRMPIPLGVRSLVFYVHRSKGGNRVHAPMDEDPKF